MLVELINGMYDVKKFKQIIKKNKKHIEIIDLKNNNISILPNLDKLIYLKELYLESNNIKILPKLNNKLVYLYISFNEIQIIPEKLNKLKYLDISCNPIENLQIIFQMPTLTHLNISNISLTNDSLKNIHLLINLNNLDISYDIRKLKNLNNLFIDNPIKNFPITIKKYLSSISVDYNFYNENLARKYKNKRLYF